MKIYFSKNNNYFLERNAGIEPAPRTGMFVFYLLNLFRKLNSSGCGNRTRTDLSVQGILSPSCLNGLEIFISSNTLIISLLPSGLYLYCLFNLNKLMLHLVSTHAHIISYAAWLGITCYPYFRTVGFLRKWIR